MKDTHLLPYILPNIFAISNVLTASQFASLVLSSLKPLFVIKEPPQNMLTLLDNLHLLQEKTERTVFRERMLTLFFVLHELIYQSIEVLPLVYNALESEHADVQERALKAVPDLCETIDYAEVQGVLFPRVAVRAIILSSSSFELNTTHSLSSQRQRSWQSKLPLLPLFLSWSRHSTLYVHLIFPLPLILVFSMFWYSVKSYSKVSPALGQDSDKRASRDGP